MKKQTPTQPELSLDNAADSVDGQGTISAGGKSNQDKTDKPCHAYLVTLRGTDKAYIGITVRKVTKRWREHATSTIKSSTPFGAALKEHGPEAFDWEWLGTFENRKEAGSFERYCTDNKLVNLNKAAGGGGSGDSWSTLSPEKKAQILYDRSQWFVTRETRKKLSDAKKGKPGNNIGWVPSDETRLKMSNSAKGRKLSDDAKSKISNALKGRKVSEETIAKIKEARSKQVFSDEDRAKMSCSRKGTKPWNVGIPVSDEVKEKLRQANLGKTLSEETRRKISESNTGVSRPSPSQEVRDRISATLMGNIPWNKGKELSEKHCRNLSTSHMGKKQSPEVIAKRVASTLATKARKKEQRLLELAMGPVIKKVMLDG